MAPTGFEPVKGKQWTLTKVETGTRLQLVHSGFVTPKNDSALKSMGDGWKNVVKNIGSIANEQG